MNEYMDNDFSTVYEQGEVISEDSYHQPDKEQRCDCDNTTRKGAYIHVVVEYKDNTYFFLHQNLIMVKLSPSRFMISNAGYKTRLTKRTLNRMLPSKFKIIQRDKDWYIEIGEERKKFRNGMVVSIE
jgi:hypothetical protein